MSCDRDLSLEVPTVAGELGRDFLRLVSEGLDFCKPLEGEMLENRSVTNLVGSSDLATCCHQLGWHSVECWKREVRGNDD